MWMFERMALGAKLGAYQQRVMVHATSKRRGHGEDSTYWDQSPEAA
jgi:hypothetical protein